VARRLRQGRLWPRSEVHATEGKGRASVTRNEEKGKEILQPGIMAHGNELCYGRDGNEAWPRALEDRKRDMPTNRLKRDDPLPSLRGPRHHDVGEDAVL
jgi:hypothetical protein